MKKIVQPADFERGFTLLEILISISVFSVITAFATANFNAGRKGDELRFASQLTASAIRRVQTSASAGEMIGICRDSNTLRDGQTCPGGSDAECAGGTCRQEVPLAYGMHLSTADGRKLISFADVNGDHVWQSGEEYRTDSVSPGALVFMSGLQVGSSAVAQLDVVFAPPKPATFFNGMTDEAAASITLTQPQTGATRTVTVNRVTGQVNAD